MQNLQQQRHSDWAGCFLAFEGGDGSGKTTQARQLAEKLQLAGYDVVLTREPGGTELAEKIRALLLDHPEPIDPITEALLFAAARSSHVRQCVLPAVRAGKVVITDRFLDSSVAYQGAGRELGTELVQRINEPAVDDVLPDLTIVLNLNTDAASARLSSRDQQTGSSADRIESEGTDFHSRVFEAFAQQARDHPERYVLVDAAASREDIHDQISQRVTELLQQRGTQGVSS